MQELFDALPTQSSRESDLLRSMLQKAREDADLTQRELCKKLRRKFTYIQKLESGEMRKLDVSEVLAILRVLGTDPGEFFEEFLREI